MRQGETEQGQKPQNGLEMSEGHCQTALGQMGQVYLRQGPVTQGEKGQGQMEYVESTGSN